jgi:putative methyltransferase (TIGR04325 family)
MASAKYGSTLRGALRKMPGVQRLQAKRYERVFLSRCGYGFSRGVFRTFDEARASVAGEAPTGPDAPGYSEHHVDRIERIFYYDYPVLHWLGPSLKKDASIFDIGGNVGVHYYSYQRYLPFPPGLTWTVCEVATLIARGESIARERSATSLRFTRRLEDAEGSDCLVSAGALQYIEAPSLGGILGALRRRPRHLLLNKLPIYDGPSFVTLQNGGVTFLPQHVFNRASLLGDLAGLGYQLRDEWDVPHLSCRVPFHEGRSVPSYTGMYLSL